MPSSVIHGMLYSPEQRALYIVYKGDREVYRYREVSPAEWTAFRHAPSKGVYLNREFKAKHPHFDLLGEAENTTCGAETMGSLRDLPDENVWGFYETSTL